MATAHRTSSHGGRALVWFAILAYGGLIAYGSLFPFSAWEPSVASPFAFLSQGFEGHYSASDVFVNLVAYGPLGFLLAFALRRRMSWLPALVSAMLLCGALSLAMEAMQSHLPSRVSSLADLLTNLVGAGAGALPGLMLAVWGRATGRLRQLREDLLRPGTYGEIAFAVSALSMFCLLGPLIPSLDATGRLTSVAPLWRAFLDISQIELPAVAGYALQAVGVMALAVLSLRRDAPRLSIVMAMLAVAMVLKFVVAVLYLGVPFHRWIVSGKALLAIMGAASVLAATARRNDRTIAIVGTAGLFGAFLIGQLVEGRPDATSGMLSPARGDMNWIPFVAQMHGSTGILDILAALAGFMCLGLTVNVMTPYHRRGVTLGLGTMVVLATSLGTEWLQQDIRGRYADATDALLALGGWLVAWSWIPLGDLSRARDRRGSKPPVARGWLAWLAPGALAGAVALGSVAALSTPVEVPLSSSGLPTHPLPLDLPPLQPRSFKHDHPRLPVPSASELATMAVHGDVYLGERERQAKGGQGRLEAAILLARVKPGSQDLDQVFHRLMQLEYGYRGVGTETVALAYDWLYEQWTEVQRSLLRDRLAEGFEFTYRVIRNERLSPYNVYLYNAPFQRLLAVAIALYMDDPRGEPAMRVANYLLKHDVLPVWRQVMGRNGGWHEGGEYVGIGIGQAIYRVPAMWRAATGEDLFRSEPGIRGFLDFLLFRTRPDGTHFRWGDAAYFDKIVPDQPALALEFHDAAAYSLGPGGARPYQPTAWPWGPLGDPSLNDAGAVALRPLSLLMDGIGTLVARSDWGPDATYVTFRAGENYWSHAHLDQGAFTIFKGAALAIDSGFYGPKYGSDHHMNYTYQTIAHNALTIWSADDDMASTNKRGESRSIANDGGQRRVGSGWGIEPAPINLQEWQFKREIYHTGSIEAYYEGDGLVVAVADITPAYTNAYSGERTFSHRVRRAERVWRIFAYDREDDVVVVQDQVVATEARYVKRWLLHTLEEPRVGERRFELRVAPRKRGMSGGSLTGFALFPKDGRLNVVGGPGFEFYVDGRNYDENGSLSSKIARRRDEEAGAWRIEWQPGAARRSDEFLVVMLPAALDAHPAHRVERLEAAGRFGCEISGPRRTTRWWFVPGENAVTIEIEEAAGRRTVRVDAATAAPPSLPPDTAASIAARSR